MSYFERKKTENTEIAERFYLAFGRLKEIPGELHAPEGMLRQEAYRAYFGRCADFLLLCAQTCQEWESGALPALPFSEKKKRIQLLYRDITGAAYEASFADPAYARRELGGEFGGLLCYLYAELRALPAYAYDGNLWEMTVLFELFLEIYALFLSSGGETGKERASLKEEVRSAIYFHERDYLAPRLEQRLREQLCPEESRLAEWVLTSDLSGPEYLYLSGAYVTEEEERTAALLSSFTEEEIAAMAATFTGGYRRGFLNNRIDLSEKKTVNIRFSLGFERLVRESIHQFAEMGLSPVVYRSADSSLHRKLVPSGFLGSQPNRQFFYDHRFDCALYWDRPYVEQRLLALRRAYEACQEEASYYAGPAVMEVFGEPPFSPVDKPEAFSLDEKQRKLYVEYQQRAAVLGNEFIRREKTSFTIIAYPVPAVGRAYPAIFQETVAVNSLDSAVYQSVQQKLIDALDQGEKVHITGRGGNRTDLWVALFPLSDPKRETCFENCLADVNIPLGEVFTSPKLKGTDGLLHVREVYLEGVKYGDLTLRFSDGMVADYGCAAGKKQVRENILSNHDTLPMGEFAIGTNTAAYAMGMKYNIFQYLPILIAEKMGPHFAVGDTCYAMAEDVAVYNPDGKEVVARENACSAIRKTDMQKAYFNCHTDITLPYHELGEVSVHTREGKVIPLLANGRFVLPGTELLNAFLDGVADEKTAIQP